MRLSSVSALSSPGCCPWQIVPPPRLCRPLSMERLTVRIENLSRQRTRNRAGRRLAAASSIDAQSLLHSLPKLAWDNGFMPPRITFLLVADLSDMNKIRQQFIQGSAREAAPPRDLIPFFEIRTFDTIPGSSSSLLSCLTQPSSR
jgi:hypothetical protein